MINATVPLKLGHPGKVDQRRRIALCKTIIEAMTEIVFEISEGRKLLVATGAGKISILAEPAIIE